MALGKLKFIFLQQNTETGKNWKIASCFIHLIRNKHHNNTNLGNVRGMMRRPTIYTLLIIYSATSKKGQYYFRHDILSVTDVPYTCLPITDDSLANQYNLVISS